MLTRAADALAVARKLAEQRRGRIAFAWSNNVIAPPRTYPQLGPAGSLLSFDVVLRAQEGDLEGALRSCRAHLHIASAIGDMPTATAQDLRNRLRSGTVRQVERVLAQGEPPAAELAALQARLAEEAEAPLWLIAARGERAVRDRFCQAMLNGEVPASDWVRSKEDASEVDGPGREIADKVAVSHGRAVMLEEMNRMVEAFKLPPEQQGKRLRELRTPEEATPPLVRRLRATGSIDPRALRSGQARLRCAVAALAVERYRQKHGRWPERLADVVPDFLTAIPADPSDGAPLRYRRLEDGAVVYSVGDDGQDGGGLLKRQGILKDPDDVGFQLWSPSRRRQPQE